MPVGPTAPRPAPALAYDELPDGSDLSREYDSPGGVTIRAPAGDLPTALRRDAARSGILVAGAACGVCLLLGGTLLLQALRRGIDPALRAPAAVALGAFCTGVFLLVWWVRYAARTELLSDARRQLTVIHADVERIVVETTGPGGDNSLELPVDRVVALQVTNAPITAAGGRARLPCLQLRLDDRPPVCLLAGHHEAELRWVAATLSQATGTPTGTAAPRAVPASAAGG